MGAADGDTGSRTIPKCRRSEDTLVSTRYACSIAPAIVLRCSTHRGLGFSAGGDDGDSTFTMATHLASIHGTEKDRVNCPFFFKSASYCFPGLSALYSFASAVRF